MIISVFETENNDLIEVKIKLKVEENTQKYIDSVLRSMPANAPGYPNEYLD